MHTIVDPIRMRHDHGTAVRSSEGPFSLSPVWNGPLETLPAHRGTAWIVGGLEQQQQHTCATCPTPFREICVFHTASKANKLPPKRARLWPHKRRSWLVWVAN